MRDEIWHNPDKHFEMGEPARIGLNSEFAFWLTAEDEALLERVAALTCVASLLEVEDGCSLVEINEDHDPDEAWHWIRSELEAEIQLVELDPLWDEAMKWL